MYISVSPYLQSTLVCKKLDTQGYFVRNFRHTNQSACVSTEYIPLKYIQVSIILKHTSIPSTEQKHRHMDVQGETIIPTIMWRGIITNRLFMGSNFLNLSCPPSEKGSFLKGKNLLSLGLGIWHSAISQIDLFKF